MKLWMIKKKIIFFTNNIFETYSVKNLYYNRDFKNNLYSQHFNKNCVLIIILIKFGKGDKLSLRFVGPFDIVERKGSMVYRLEFPHSLRRMHDVFHVSVLRHYVSDPTHVIGMSSLKVWDEGALTKEPICILDHHIWQLRRITVDQVKVQWDNYSPHSMT
jgi:hypothetical protein